MILKVEYPQVDNLNMYVQDGSPVDLHIGPEIQARAIAARSCDDILRQLFFPAK